MTKSVILTGLRANNDLTIGNYFGGMLPMIDMAKTRSSEFQINMFIPDLHSFTTPINHDELYEQILHNARLFVAAGLPLDNENIHLYRQSYIPAHSELTWILDCFAKMGDLGRMTQFKDKSKKITDEIEGNSALIQLFKNVKIPASKSARDELKELYKILGEAGKTEIASRIESIHKELLDEKVKDLKELLDLYKELKYNSISRADVPVGLFNYPVLMAADILLYGAKYVPVGDDQTQHLEFTRDIAERMNSKFKEQGLSLVVPEPVAKQHEFFGKDQGLRIKDLVDPTKKMSKSDDTGKGVIFLGDDPEVAAHKIMSATTDDKANVQLDREGQPGISNLLEILALLRGQAVEETAAQFVGETRYGDFKKVVADEVKTFLSDFQSKLANVDDTAVLAKLQASEEAMNAQANATLLKVQQAVGLRPRG